MTDLKTKTKVELQDEILNFVRRVAKEIPGAGKVMQSAIPRMSDDVMHRFSRDVVSRVGGYVLDAAKFNNGLTPEEAERLIVIIGEHAKIMEESRNTEALQRSQELVRGFRLGLRYASNLKSAQESLGELANLGMGLLTSRFDDNLGTKDKMAQLENLKERALELTKEKNEIIKELRELSSGKVDYNSKATILTKEIVSAKIGKLNRSSATPQDVIEKKFAEGLLAKIRTVALVEKTERQWSEIQKECEEYFSLNAEQSDEVDETGERGRVALGLIITSL